MCYRQWTFIRLNTTHFITISHYRKFVESRTCVEEFFLAYDQIVQGRRQHIIVVLVDKPGPRDLPPELDNYLKRHTYIEAYNYMEEMDAIRDKMRCAMPNVALKQLKVSHILRKCKNICLVTLVT